MLLLAGMLYLVTLHKHSGDNITRVASSVVTVFVELSFFAFSTLLASYTNYPAPTKSPVCSQTLLSNDRICRCIYESSMVCWAVPMADTLRLCCLVLFSCWFQWRAPYT